MALRFVAALRFQNGTLILKLVRFFKQWIHFYDSPCKQINSSFINFCSAVNFESEKTEGRKYRFDQPACNGCGNCCGGCNTGAKQTLNMNYLPDAKCYGAKIFTEVNMLTKFSPRSDQVKIESRRFWKKKFRHCIQSFANVKRYWSCLSARQYWQHYQQYIKSLSAMLK